MDKKKRLIKEKNKKSETLIGVLQKTKKGFGFVLPENGQRDIFIPREALNGAMHGDIVEVSANCAGSLLFDAREGEIKRIVARSVTVLVGTFDKNKKYGFVVPSDRKIQENIFVAKKDFKGAQKGDIVLVKIVRYPDHENSPEGKIIEIISKMGEPGGDIKGLIRQYGLISEFPKKVTVEAEFAARRSALPTKEGHVLEIGSRSDLREKNIITIDGADAKDLDDAISIEIRENGNYLLGVHIADVTHYVASDSALDKEALTRGNSVYLIDQVIPMLPKVLSNGVCSLNPGEDRLTVSVDVEISPGGVVERYHIYESVIRSKARMTYTDVSDILEKQDTDLLEQYAPIHQDLLRMEQLAQILKKRREVRGSLDFDFDEALIKLDEMGKARSIQIAERRTANRMIEEFMLMANEVVAEHFFWMDVPFVFRVHEKPSLEKMEVFKVYIQSFGLVLKGKPENIHPKVLNDLLGQISGKPYENVINTIMLRSMKKAFYSTNCDGHFGLGLKYYCHFTSPIRRYPDLMIHRIIKESLTGTQDGRKNRALRKKTEKVAEIASLTERKALELEREVEKLKKAEYMSYHIGEVFEGIISGVTSYGLYVELENTIEGLVRLDFMVDDFYDFERDKYRMVGRFSNRIYALGDKMTVRVYSVSIEERQIDFVPEKSKIKKNRK